MTNVRFATDFFVVVVACVFRVVARIGVTLHIGRRPKNGRAAAHFGAVMRRGSEWQPQCAVLSGFGICADERMTSL